ncbi:hypothetical protein Pelo_18921 [Pelomyxa schiedti]|nr:hypothetical protein Pelo_18921 [Pelomyxa schiedti]
MDATASDTTTPEGSSCSYVKVKDQFAAILMCAHPRCCGMHRAQDLSSDTSGEEAIQRVSQCDSLGAIRVLWDWISRSAPTRWFFLMSSAYNRGIAFGVSPLMGAVTSDVRFLQLPPKVCVVCANPFCVLSKEMTIEDYGFFFDKFSITCVTTSEVLASFKVPSAKLSPEFPAYSSCNGRWFLVLGEKNSLLITPLFPVQQGDDITRSIPLSSGTGGAFSFNDEAPDEALCYSINLDRINGVWKAELTHDDRITFVRPLWPTSY